jgi:cobalt-zinc-cadmium efflux system outer membrane protein
MGLDMKLMVTIGLSLIFSQSAEAQSQPLTLTEALAMLDQHPQWQEGQAKVAQSVAEQQTAAQYLNPTIELMGESRDKQSLAFYQPFETTAVRNSRQSGADKGVDIATYQANWLHRQLITYVERLYYQIAQRQQELILADEELELLAQLRHAVTLRVKVGESPRYEQVKAEAEWLTSKNRRAVASQQYVLAQQQLAEHLALKSLPEIVAVKLEEPAQCVLAKLDAPLQQHPITLAAQTTLTQSQDKMRYEQALTTPQPTVIVGAEQELGIDRVKLGISLPLPIWHQRDGQIAAAKANVNQSQAKLDTVARQLKQEWTRSVLNYQIAQGQMMSFESGLLAEANSAFKVAQAAYKYGERGILDYIDAQRTLASVKKGYVNSQFERHYACLDILQLTALGEEQQ